jgi:hypothetical protein
MRRRIFLIEENVPGVVLSLGAYASRVQYEIDGTIYDTLVTNDEFILLDEDD